MYIHAITVEIYSANGEQKFRTKIPDTITSWVLTAFSLNKVTGLGITKASTTLTAFKPFFVSVSLPYSVKHGETVSIPIIVFNYLDVSARAQVTLHNVDGEFEFADLDKGNYATNSKYLSPFPSNKWVTYIQSKAVIYCPKIPSR